MSSNPDPEYGTIADVKKAINFTNTEFPDADVIDRIKAKSRMILAKTNRDWSPSDFLWETVVDLTARYVAVGMLEKRGKYQEAADMKRGVDRDIADMMKSPYLTADDTGIPKKGGVFNVLSTPRSWYRNNQATQRYKSNWARTGSSGFAI